MKSAYRNALAFLLFGFSLVACSTSRNTTPSVIKIVPLVSYSKVSDVGVADTSYHIIRNDETFSANFRALSADAIKPDFAGQMVVALLTPQPAYLQYERATHNGPHINIYLRSCIPPAEPACGSGNFFLATIPKVGDARSVQFFINNVGKETINF